MKKIEYSSNKYTTRWEMWVSLSRIVMLRYNFFLIFSTNKKFIIRNLISSFLWFWRWPASLSNIKTVSPPRISPVSFQITTYFRFNLTKHWMMLTFNSYGIKLLILTIFYWYTIYIGQYSIFRDMESFIGFLIFVFRKHAKLLTKK